MFRFLSCRNVLSLLLFATFVCSRVAAEEPKKVPPTKEQVAQWIRDLGDSEFDKREKASKQLWEAGRLAEAPLKEALKSDDVEVKRRSSELLNKFKWGIYPETPARLVEMIQRYQGGANEDAKGAILQELLDEGADGRTAYAKIAAAEDKKVLDTVRASASLAFVKRGLEKYSNKDHDRAVKDFDEAVQLDPKNAFAFSIRGFVWVEKKDYGRALKGLDEAIRLDPKNGFAFTIRGWIWGVKKDYDRALQDLNEAVRIDPENVRALTMRAGVWSEKKDQDRALKDLDEAIRLDPENPNTFLARGQTWNQKKDYDRALKDYDEAIRLDPQNADAFHVRGQTWNHKKDYGRAIKDFEEAIRLDPKNPIRYNSKAWLLGSCPDKGYRDGKQALELATKACELTEWKAPFFYDVLAVAYAETGDFDKAVEWVEKALKDKGYEKEYGDETRERLKLFKDKKPFREK